MTPLWDKFDIQFNNSWAWVKTDINQNRHKDLTLLTIGDSFTWGDELGNSNGLMSDPKNDSDYRESKIYGNLLANSLDSNWVQHALPGASNEWIIREAEKLIPQLYDNTKLIVVLTLTELGRELCNKDDHTPVIEIFKNQFSKQLGIIESLDLIEQYYWQRLSDLQNRYPNITLLTNYGFTYNIASCEFITEKNWLDVVLEYKNIAVHPKLTLFETGTWVINEFLSHQNLLLEKHKHETGELYFVVDIYRDLLKDSNMYFKRYHPNEQAHELWANYLHSAVSNKL